MSEALSLPGIEGKMDALSEAQLTSEEARKLFEARWGPAAWMEDYWALRGEGWPWRQAAYIVWASMPKDQREPRTQGEFAQRELGLGSDRAIRKWRAQNPMIEVAVRDLTISTLTKARAAIYEALVMAASNPNPRAHADRKLALEMLGDYVPRQRVGVGVLTADDLADMDTEALRALALGPGSNVAGEHGDSSTSLGMTGRSADEQSEPGG